MNQYISHHEHHEHHTRHAGEYVSRHAPRPVRIDVVHARQILDSRGNPTLTVALLLDGDGPVEASAPSGASTGAHEAIELRDGLPAFDGRGVHQAIELVNTQIADQITSRAWSKLRDVDDMLRELDGTDDYRRLGANSVVAVSMAMTRAFAAAAELSLFEWFAHETRSTPLLPVPHFNVLNGGAHAANELAFQEFMVAPVGAPDEAAAVQAGAEIYHALAGEIHREFAAGGLGDEGGFAPTLRDSEAALELLVGAIRTAGYTPGINDVAIALDPAANGFSLGGGRYRADGHDFTREELAAHYEQLASRYPIRSIEDGFAEDDLEGWRLLNERLGSQIQIVGDDLYVTDPARIRDGADQELSNAVLIKPNQIGTVSQTLDAIAAATSRGLACMVSHRSGETTDTFIADLAVGTGVGQIKAGAPARGERTAKYNRLTEIEATNSVLPYGLALPAHADVTVRGRRR